MKNSPHLSSPNMSSNQELTGQIQAAFAVDLLAAVGGVTSLLSADLQRLFLSMKARVGSCSCVLHGPLTAFPFIDLRFRRVY